MEIPSSAAGVVKECASSSATRSRRDHPSCAWKPAPPRPQPLRRPSRRLHRLRRRPPRQRLRRPRRASRGGADLECDVLVLGAGPGGYSAAFRAADLGLKVVLVERYASLGGVCLNVGCIPSKALLHVAAVMDEAAHFADLGVAFGAPKLSVDKLRAHKNKVVGKLTGGLAAMAKMRKVTVVRGYGSFTDPNHLEVELTTGDAQERTGQNSDSLRAMRSSPPAQRGQPAVHAGRSPRRRLHRRARVARAAEADADRRRRHHRPGDGHCVLDARGASRRRRDARRPDAGRRPRPRESLAEAQPAALRQRHAEDEDGCGRGQAGRAPGPLRGRSGAGGAAALRPGSAGGRPHAQRPQDRRRQGRRGGRRARLRSGRRADADQRAAHLRDRRHRRPADAGAQGGARRARGGRGRGGAQGAFRRARDPVGGLHRS